MTASGSNDRPRFLTDEDFNMDVTEGLRLHDPQMDVRTVQEAGLLHVPDPQLLREAQRIGRILLSHDGRTMPGHFYDLLSQLAADERHPGVILVPQDTAVGTAIAWISEIWEASRHDEWRDMLTRLPL